MQIPMRNRHVTINLERLSRAPVNRPELIGASDHELERLARLGHQVREPRWEVPAMMLGLRP